jgi:hypothetical protein
MFDKSFNKILAYFIGIQRRGKRKEPFLSTNQAETIRYLRRQNSRVSNFSFMNDRACFVKLILHTILKSVSEILFETRFVGSSTRSQEFS